MDSIYSDVKQKDDTFIKLVLVCEVYRKLHAVLFYENIRRNNLCPTN